MFNTLKNCIKKKVPQQFSITWALRTRRVLRIATMNLWLNMLVTMISFYICKSRQRKLTNCTSVHVSNHSWSTLWLLVRARIRAPKKTLWQSWLKQWKSCRLMKLPRKLTDMVTNISRLSTRRVWMSLNMTRTLTKLSSRNFFTMMTQFSRTSPKFTNQSTTHSLSVSIMVKR